MLFSDITVEGICLSHVLYLWTGLVTKGGWENMKNTNIEQKSLLFSLNVHQSLSQCNVQCIENSLF